MRYLAKTYHNIPLFNGCHCIYQFVQSAEQMNVRANSAERGKVNCVTLHCVALHYEVLHYAWCVTVVAVAVEDEQIEEWLLGGQGSQHLNKTVLFKGTVSIISQGYPWQFEPIRFSRLAGYRQHIYNNVLFYLVT